MIKRYASPKSCLSAFICETLYTIAKICKLFIYPYLSKSHEEKNEREVSVKEVYTNQVRISQSYMQSA